tara:strand:- start:1827 stop:2237 length:411 start_codon:yes stop_codon:yes gene_type:complete
MPGENPLPIDVQVDFQQDVIASLNISTELEDAFIYFCERETVVDFACIGADIGDVDATFTLKHCAVAADGSITAADSGTAFTDALAFATTDVPEKKEFTMITTQNVIPANSYIALSASAASSASGVLQLRLRTKRR